MSARISPSFSASVKRAAYHVHTDMCINTRARIDVGIETCIDVCIDAGIDACMSEQLQRFFIVTVSF